jgi:hypothetical protein
LRRSRKTPGSLAINRALRPYPAEPRYLTLIPGALLRRRRMRCCLAVQPGTLRSAFKMQGGADA